jgi:hypothetical protein
MLLLALAVLVTSVAAFLAVGRIRWRAGTRTLVGRLAHGSGQAQLPFVLDDLEGPPDPVARYFRTVLQEGQPLVRTGAFRQEGQFLVRPTADGWRPFEAVHHFCTRPCGFVWDARIRMGPGLDIRVRDGFVQGRGVMRASLLGVVPVASIEGTPEIGAGALHRYLAEAVWYPTALLPKEGIVWSPLDASTARATLTVSGIAVWLDFRFGPDGLVQSVFTPGRARDVGGRAVPTPWQGRFSEYEEREGMHVPMAGEVEWLLPDGPQVYWRGRIVEAGYSFEGG